MKWQQAAQRENPPSGTHVARCIGIIDLGTQQTTFEGKTKSSRKVLIQWELPTCLMEGIYNPEHKGKPFAVSRRYTQSLATQATLRSDLESWRGRKFSPADLQSFDPKKLLGSACMLSMIESENGEYVNVDGISPVPKGLDCPKATNPFKYLSLEPGEFDVAVFNNLGPKFQELITSSPEYQRLMQPSDAQVALPAEPHEAKSDDIPF